MPSDMTILRALHEQAPAPVSARLLAERYRVSVEELTTRMRSLVSLGYVECVPGAQDDAYLLHDQSLLVGGREPSIIRPGPQIASFVQETAG
jgi:DNA-binding IclR family transcriptional regulator